MKLKIILLLILCLVISVSMVFAQDTNWAAHSTSSKTGSSDGPDIYGQPTNAFDESDSTFYRGGCAIVNGLGAMTTWVESDFYIPVALIV